MNRTPTHRTCNPAKGGCGETFAPWRSTQKACSPRCAQNFAAKTAEKKAAKAAQDDRRQTRQQLEAIKTVPMLKKEAQHAFNGFIRSRDRSEGFTCICCGKQLEWDVPGGAVDAGHWRSTGSADNLRFNEDNCHAQRSDCNRFGAGRAVDYRVRLIARIGPARVEALEANNTPMKWTRDGLREVRDRYRRLASKLRERK